MASGPQAGEGRAAGLPWEVRLPERSVVPIGARKPMACVLIAPATSGEEELRVPVAVGRRLAAGREDGTIVPDSRAELLYHVGRLSRECARDRLNRMLSHRDYSTQEAVRRLGTDGYSEKVASEVVARAAEVGLVDDERFAVAFIRSKVLSGWGELRIARELRQRGIDVAEIEGWPGEFLEGSEFDRALALASRRSLRQRCDPKSVARFLSSRGFSSGCALAVARQVSEEARREASD